MKDRLETGLVQTYFGGGKGKTTAALGLAVRAAGRGARVLFARFMISCRAYGEIEAVKALDEIEIVLLGREVDESEDIDDYAKYHVDRSNPREDDIDAAAVALRFCRREMAEGACDVVVLDEVLYAIEYGLLPVGDVVEAVNGRANGVEAVLTGGTAPIELSDLATEFCEIRHHMGRGITGVEGIDY